MSHSWDPPDPDRGGDAFPAWRSNRSVGIVLLVLTALIAGGVVSYVLSQVQDAREGDAAPPPLPSATSTVLTATTTIPATTTTSIVVTGDHMVFADGYPLGQITPTGFAAYQGDAASQLRQGPVEMSGIVNFVGSQFSAQVRPLDPGEISASCPVTVQPRAADNADPLGLWIESPTWQLQPPTATPVPLSDPNVQAVVQLITASNGVQPAPPPQRGSAVMVDLIGDGIPDLIVSATFTDDNTDVYYRLVAVAPDGNPDAATPVLLEFGTSFRPDGSRDPQSRGELRVDGVVEVTGKQPYELFIRRTTANTKGVTIRDLAGNEIAAYTCPR